MLFWLEGGYIKVHKMERGNEESKPGQGHTISQQTGVYFGPCQP